MDEQRNRRLQSLFHKVLEGKQAVHPTMFLEAIRNQRDTASCVWRLLGSDHGISALRTSFMADTSATFINNHIWPVLQYFRATEVAAVCSGDLLRRLICELVEPPVFWNGFIVALEANLLSLGSLDCFAWLLLQLLSIPDNDREPFIRVARSSTVEKSLGEHVDPNIRNIYERIKHVMSVTTVPTSDSANGPGGRHDNDFENFRMIDILPTTGELASSEPPFLRFASEIEQQSSSEQFATHLDNQYRLLRDDMVRDLREEISTSSVSSRTKRKALRIHQTSLVSLDCHHKLGWSITLECCSDIPGLPQDGKKRRAFLQNHPKFLGNDSLCCLLVDNQPVALGTIRRSDEELCQNPPLLFVRLPDNDVVLKRLYSQIKTKNELQLVQLATAVFSHEPVLKQLQNTRSLPLAEEFMTWKPGYPVGEQDWREQMLIKQFVTVLRADKDCDLQAILSLQKAVNLNGNQIDSLLSGLTQKICLIQGPPGTGKSFIGALIAKAIMKLTKKKILVLSYTNHAMDQYLEDLLDIGIAENDMVRLGYAAKASIRTRQLALRQEGSSRSSLSRDSWDLLASIRAAAGKASSKLLVAFKHYLASSVTPEELMDHLEFSDEHRHVFDGWQVPNSDNGFRVIGTSGKTVGRFYLLDRWCRLLDAGVFKDHVDQNVSGIWSIEKMERSRLLRLWRDNMLAERLSQLIECGKDFNNLVKQMNSIYRDKDREFMSTKRIIACTTSVAAKHVKEIQAVAPEIVIVEEAGEILESHILTAIGPQTEQLILIGDHKQLRPKVHHDLSVEVGTGYDLNRSLFERLVLKGFPHTTLSVQHRMRSEISELVRCLTYPELLDSGETKNRASLRGFQSSVVFVNHKEMENELENTYDPREGRSISTKNNLFEAHMTLKCVRYLAQQGYRSDQIVVLTPYLGQLRLLLDVLKEDNDPVLEDMDSYDLIRAGILPAATSAIGKPKLRISTIDNYQGEESDVVVVSMTRSNKNHDIGFLSSPERLNVLLSRAKLGLIIIGNVSTFIEARKGKALWNKFFDLMRRRSFIYDGVPVKCEQHSKRLACLQQPTDFDTYCPDGGCDIPCETTLACKHPCPQKCHQLSDHSKMACELILKGTCSRGHPIRWKCSSRRTSACQICLQEKKRDEAKQQEDFKHKQNELLAQQDHNEELAKLDARIDLELRKRQVARLKNERQITLQQKAQDLENARNLPFPNEPLPKKTTKVNVIETEPGSIKSSTPENGLSETRATTANVFEEQSAAFHNWQSQKTLHGQQNSAMDELMKMTGLETVKEMFLSVLDKLNTVKRQGVDLASERMGVVFLGNPGTGKTTVARHYVKFLSILGVLPGVKFVESTGSKLANEGVRGTQKALNSILEAGGGAFFIDEAYQLVSGHNPGGAAVLDFLLAEIENTMGKVIFILAGYKKQMEKFFEHNPGLKSRVPYCLSFEDYSESEFLTMMKHKVEERYHGRMMVEDGPQGLFMRIAVRRLHRNSGKEGFGNARALENLFDVVKSRQAKRIAQERAKNNRPDDFLFTKEDIIGPEPSNALLSSSAWKKLQQLVGLGTIKQDLQTLVNRLQLNYQRELQEKQPIEVSLNRLFIGSPGTGKTTVAKLYGQILCEIGLLSTSECVVKTPADFIGSVLGESEKNTKAILESTQGKVLVIDEAYMLCSSLGNSASSASSDIYRTAVIDTIVSEVHSVPGEDRAVLLLGYREQMEEMLRSVNPGLARRFPVDSAFVFEDYNDDELLSILEFKLKQQDLMASDDAKSTAISVLAKIRRRPNFGNAGEVENLLGRAKDAFQKRQRAPVSSQQAQDIILESQDFDVDFGRSRNAVDACKGLFKDIVGREDVFAKLVGYVETNQMIREIEGQSPEDYIPFNFVFRGPPGTGKTTTARLIGEVFYNMEFLASSAVIECSATDLVGSYVGHTGPKVRNKLDEALGKVLLIDEAYRLGEGAFAKEAVDELVDALTKPRYKGKLIVILAGYEDEINQLLSINPGLASRFSERLDFTNLTPKECLMLLVKNFSRQSFTRLSFTAADKGTSDIIDLFKILSGLPSWGNARDIETIAKNVTRKILRSGQKVEGKFVIHTDDVVEVLYKFREEREGLTASKIGKDGARLFGQSDLPIKTLEPHRIMFRHSHDAAHSNGIPTNTKSEEIEVSSESSESAGEEGIHFVPDPDVPDLGVSEADFKALLDAKNNMLMEDELSTKSLEQAKDHERYTLENFEAAEAYVASQSQSESNKDDEARRLHETLRLKALELKRQHEIEVARVQKLEEDKRIQREKEVKVQKRLREMGVCPAGYRWIKQNGGYRCAGGSHFVSESQLGI